MHLTAKKKIVVLGMMSRQPVAGMVFITLQYLVGFDRLGYDVYYVEPQGGGTGEDSSMPAAWIDSTLRRFDLGGHWAYHAVHGDGRCYGISEVQLNELYQSAALIINLHGSTKPTPELSATGRLVYLETDPVEIEVSLYEKEQWAYDFLAPHSAFFSWGENYGRPDCKLPIPRQFQFHPTRQPTVMDLWEPFRSGRGAAFTTIGNWRQQYREVDFMGEKYYWSKHYEFLKFIDLPSRTAQSFELALGRYEPSDQAMLERNGWRVVPAAGFSSDLDAYRSYVGMSRGEFTVAKDQNVRLRSGWFSDRSACYLTTGRPVINQETGFSNTYPTGRGLFAFTTMDDILSAVEAINADYERHSSAASAIAREYFSYDVVLPALLSRVGM
jgi:hypothetical protein